MYGPKGPSVESLGPRIGISVSSTPTFVDHGLAGSREAYPAWGADRNIPLSKEEIEDIFLDLTQKFGFQRDSMRNMVRAPFLTVGTQIVIPNLVRLHHANIGQPLVPHDPKSSLDNSPRRLYWRSACELPQVVLCSPARP